MPVALAIPYGSLHYLNNDGQYGQASYDSVKLFQSHNGLSANGVLGGSTWSTLCSVALRVDPKLTTLNFPAKPLNVAGAYSYMCNASSGGGTTPTGGSGANVGVRDQSGNTGSVQVALGSSETLTWTVTNYTGSCTRTASPTNSGGWSGTVGITKSPQTTGITVKPASSGTYTYNLTCGSTSAPFKITVLSAISPSSTPNTPAVSVANDTGTVKGGSPYGLDVRWSNANSSSTVYYEVQLRPADHAALNKYVASAKGSVLVAGFAAGNSGATAGSRGSVAVRACTDSSGSKCSGNSATVYYSFAPQVSGLSVSTVASTGGAKEVTNVSWTASYAVSCTVGYSNSQYGQNKSVNSNVGSVVKLSTVTSGINTVGWTSALPSNVAVKCFGTGGSGNSSSTSKAI